MNVAFYDELKKNYGDEVAKRYLAIVSQPQHIQALQHNKALKEYKMALLRKKQRLYLYKGKKYTTGQLAEISGLSSQLIFNRIHSLGYSVEEAVETPKRERKRPEQLYLYQGKKYTRKQLAELAGIKPMTMYWRLQRYSVEDAVNGTFK